MNKVRHVAIVDDHAMFRKGLSVLVNMFPNYEVLYDASSGRELIQKLSADNLPDIVLLDISMPEMDGYETAEYLKNNHPEILVLALSTIDADASIIKMIRHGARGYILKDAEPTELKQAFDEVSTFGFFYNERLTRRIMQSISQLVDDKSPLPTFARLSDRELQFLKLACSEKTYTEIAKEMYVSERTVDGYRDALFKKLGMSTRVGLVLYAIKNKIVEL